MWELENIGHICYIIILGCGLLSREGSFSWPKQQRSKITLCLEAIWL